MDATAESLRALIAPAVRDAGLLLEAVRVSRAGAHSQVMVIVDLPETDPGDLDLDRIAQVTTAVSEALDLADVLPASYRLEVSSPGVDRPLREHRHFVRARGRLVQVTLRDGGTVAGRLVEVGDEDIVVVPSAPARKGRRPAELPPVRIALADVASGRVEVDLAALGHEGDEDGED